MEGTLRQRGHYGLKVGDGSRMDAASLGRKEETTREGEIGPSGGKEFRDGSYEGNKKPL